MRLESCFKRVNISDTVQVVPAVRFREQECEFAKLYTEPRFDAFSGRARMEATSLIAGCSSGFEVAEVGWALASVLHVH